MRKHVWIMNHYAGGMFFDQGGRHYNFAKYLKRSGYEPVVFCANSIHGKTERYFDTQDLWHIHTAGKIGVPWVFVRARTYTGNGKQRILNMIDFYRNVKRAAREYAAQYGKPDIIYASSVHPLTLVAGLRLAKHFGVKCVCEIRDLWPSSIVIHGYAGPRNPVILALRRMEKWIYKEADALIFTMEGAYDYIQEQGWEKDVPRSKTHYINNGVDLDAFQYNLEHFCWDDPDLDDPNTFKLVYTGSIRKANGLVELVKCAKVLQNEKCIKFLVYGTGTELDELRECCRKEVLTNVVFKGPVEKKYVPSILTRGDASLLNYAPTTEKLFRFGNSQNKLFEYLAAGKPMITNVKLSYNPASRRHCCYTVASPEEKDYAALVLELYHLPLEEYERVCCAARETAEEYDFKNLAKKLMSVLEGVE